MGEILQTAEKVHTRSKGGSHQVSHVLPEGRIAQVVAKLARCLSIISRSGCQKGKMRSTYPEKKGTRRLGDKKG
jgi:hypothetical protein